jgi:hypothetical protein
MMIQFGISGYDAQTGLTGILPYLFQRKSEAYSMIETLKNKGGDRLKVIEFTWEELYRVPVKYRSPEVSELYKRLNEALDKLGGK